MQTPAALPPQRPDRADGPAPLATPARIAMTVALLIALPALVYYLWDCLRFAGGQLALPSAAMLQRIPRPSTEAAAIVAGWLVFQALLQAYVPSRRIVGAPLSDGTRLSYRINGWAACWISAAALAAGAALGLYRPAALADLIGPLLTTSILVAVAVSLALYAHGRRAAATGRKRVTRNEVCDFWLGTALNPRIGAFDLKLFFEARPGLIGWVALDVACAFKQYELHGGVSVPMLLVCAFHAWYVADYFKHEPAILSTWDVRRENFGFMLCFGNLVWVPFTYTIQAYYLIDHPHDLPWWAVAGIVALNAAGYVMFRGANLQKHRFRENPARPVWGRPPVTIRAPQGSLLLASGWWGVSRHMNYLGDLVMALAWCLPCGFASPLPYFYVAYLAILLVHRERRDHAWCAARYGEAWQAYCAKVRHRIVPGLY